MEKTTTYQKILIVAKLFINISIGIGVFILGVYVIKTQRPDKQGFFCSDTSIRYTYNGDTVSTKMLLTGCLGSAILIPFVIEFIQTFRKDENRHAPALKWVILSAILVIGTFLYGLAISSTIMLIIKSVTRVLRPHFIDTCRPNFTEINCDDGYILKFNCTNLNRRAVYEASLSFPSGHAAYSMYTATFLILYLHRRMTAFYCTGLLKSVIQLGLLLWGLICTVTRVSDHRHHWSDVVAGGFLGLCVALWRVKIVWRRFGRKIHKPAPLDELFKADPIYLEEKKPRKGLKSEISTAALKKDKSHVLQPGRTGSTI